MRGDVTNLLILVAIFCAFAALIYFSFVWPFIAARASPPSDLTQIKVRMDGEGRRVLNVERDGVDWTVERGGAKTWRKYRLVIQYSDGTRVPRIVGVHSTLFSKPDLVIYKDGVRSGLWTQAQASLP